MASNLLFYVLGQDDMPACPTHGIRLVTDFFTSEAGEQFERGKCPLCKRTYTFVIEEETENDSQ